MLKILALLAAILTTTSASAQSFCVSIDRAMALESEFPQLKRLKGGEHTAFLAAFNEQEPKTDYAGPVWYWDRGASVVIGVVEPTGVAACFLEVAGGQAEKLRRAMRDV